MNLEGDYYQFAVESQVIDHVKTALRNTLASDVERLGLERKISSVRFVTDSLARHLTRLLDLEDECGLLSSEEFAQPQLAQRASELQREHDQFRDMLEDLSATACELQPHDEKYFAAFCRNVAAFLDNFERHERAEKLVLRQMLAESEGGES